MELFFIFIFGLAVGSFLNVLIDRLPKGESIISGRSHCEHCRKTLKWYDLIPVLSFILLDGKCRHCHSSISFYYPGVEMITGVIFVLSISIFTPGIMNYELGIMDISLMAYYLLILSSLIVVFFTDLKYGIIPDKIIFPAIAVLFFFSLLTSYFQLPTSHVSLLNSFFSGLGAFLFFLFLVVATRGRGMGLGDVKFVFLMGLVLGFPKIVIGLYIAFVAGAIISLILIIFKKKKLFGTTIPFGPFLAFGTIFSLFAGDLVLKIVLPYFL